MTVDEGGADPRLVFDIRRQPDDTTCGPTCLHAVYAYWGDHLPLEQVIAETAALGEGGTLAVMLGCHALERGYQASLVTYNLEVFDPTWLKPGVGSPVERLRAQLEAKPHDSKLQVASRAYLRFLELGGTIHMRDLTPGLLRKPLKKGLPVLTGLSATFLYQSEREVPETNQPDDVHGRPAGHFVVLCGYESEGRRVVVADPYFPNPMSPTHTYTVPIERAMTSILLGVLTYDANMLLIQPAEDRADSGETSP